MFLLREHQQVLLLPPTGKPRIQVSTQNGLVSFRWTGNETLSTLLRRAYDIVNSYELVHTEFMNIKRMLSRNGYPNNFLDRCIHHFLNRKHGVTQQRDSSALLHPNQGRTQGGWGGWG